VRYLSIKLVLKWLLGILFIFAGLNHFRVAELLYVKIMPPYLPWHLELVYLSGVVETALGVLLLVRKFTILAAWGLIALLIAVFPANIHMALHAELFPVFDPAVLWLRLPLQGVIIAWAYWFTRKTPQGTA
jgi:uncharacterized membrane protein